MDDAAIKAFFDDVWFRNRAVLDRALCLAQVGQSVFRVRLDDDGEIVVEEVDIAAPIQQRI